MRRVVPRMHCDCPASPTPKQVHQYSDDEAKEQHSNNGKIEAHIFFFYPYVTRQSAKPMQLVMKKVNNNTSKYNHHSNDNYVFTCLWIHKRYLSSFSIL